MKIKMEKTATFTVTDALLSPISFSMLSGAGVIDSKSGEKIVHLTVDGTVVADSTNNGKVKIDGSALAGYSLITDETEAAKLRPYAMVLDQNGGIVDYLGEKELGNKIEADGTDYVIKSEIKYDTALNGLNARVDCYVIANAPVTTLTIDAEHFGGTFYIEAETLFRDEATGQDFPATFIIPKGKIQGNFTFSMAATGDPSTFDFTIDCTRGVVRTLGSSTKEQVLYAIDIIDNISTSEAHTEDAKIDIPGTDSTWSAKAKA